MTKQSLGNRSFINQVKYSPKWSSDAIVGTNDGNVWIGFNLGTGTPNQANWVNVTGSNTVLPNRPVLGIALDPRLRRDPGDRLRGHRRLQRQHADDPRPHLPGHVHGDLRHVHLGRQEREPARHPRRLGDRQPEHAAAGLRRNRLGRLLHRRHHGGLADLVPLRERDAALDGLGPPDRSRRDDALGLDAKPRRLRVSAGGRAATAATASAASTTAASTTTASATSTTATSTSASATTASATATTATATTTASATASTTAATATATATATAGALPRAEGDRTEARNGEDEDPQGTLLGGSHPSRPLEASRPCDRPEPEARRLQAPRLPGQARRRPALSKQTSETRGAPIGAPLFVHAE